MAVEKLKSVWRELCAIEEGGRLVDITDVALFIALALMGAGLAGYDWRIGCIVIGAIILFALKPMWKWIK